jgi:hypothetical protein
MCQIHIIYHVRILLDASISPLDLVQNFYPCKFFPQKLFITENDPNHFGEERPSKTISIIHWKSTMISATHQYMHPKR